MAVNLVLVSPSSCYSFSYLHTPVDLKLRLCGESSSPWWLCLTPNSGLECGLQLKGLPYVHPVCSPVIPFSVCGFPFPSSGPFPQFEKLSSSDLSIRHNVDDTIFSVCIEFSSTFVDYYSPIQALCEGVPALFGSLAFLFLS